LLATEVTGDHEGAHSFADEVREAAAERLDQLLEWLDDPDLADVEDVFLVALEDTLTPLVAGSSDDPEALSELARGLSRYAGRVGLVLGRVRPAGPRTDELLVRLAQQAGDCGDTGALAMLSAIDEPRDVPASVLHEALMLALKSPDDETLAMRARAACEAVADWPECSELTAHLLGRIVLAPVPFQLRTAGAAALASQPVWRESMLQVVTAGLESELHLSDPATQAGVVGAGLWLGSANPDVVMAAVRLVQEGWPPELLAPALAQALRRQPDLVDPLVALGQRPGSARTPLLLLLGGLVDAAQQDHALGPYLTVPPLTSGVRVGLTTVLLDVVQSTDDPAPAGAAAVLACWLSRGQEELASLMFDLRHDAGRGALHGWLNVALGACGVADAKVQALLASDAATAEPELAESAGIGLAALFDTASQIDGEALDPHGADIARRLAGDGAEADSLRTALITLSALPLG
jgi:hypothetical protein